MNREEIEELTTRIKLIKYKMKDIIGPNAHMDKVIVLGVTGCGKSSLTACLANEKVLIQEGAGKKVILVNPRIGDGFYSVTKEPSIIVDSDSKIMYCDCPGFEDTESYKQEVVNAFVIDYLFKISTKCRFKILLVISESQFDSSRGQSIKNCLERMNKMFPNPGELEQGIGLVITKGDIDVTPINYIEQMESDSSESVKNWCNFFKNNLDRVFVFPQALRKDLNKEYHFDDYSRLKKFLTIHHIFNPVHKIALSINATEYMISLGGILAQKVKDTVNCIFLKITDNYLLDKKTFYLRKWLRWMNGLKDRNVKTSDDLCKFLHDYFPGNAKYNYYMESLNDSEAMNDFFLKVLGIDYLNNTLEENVSRLVSYAINELNALYEKALICDEQEARRIEFEQMIANKKRQIEEQLRQEQILQVEIEKKKMEIQQQRIQQENLQRQIRH